MAASLSPGVLQQLLQEMAPPATGEDLGCSRLDGGSQRRRTPALLQVTSIVPALGGGGGLFPDRGFFLKVSDSCHAIYAALPQEQDDLILGDELQLGQLIRVQGLEPASPVPVLRGVEPLPGRHPCVGDTSDLVAAVPGRAREPPAPNSGPAGFLPVGGGPSTVPPLPESRNKSRSISASRGEGDGWRNSWKAKNPSRSIPTSPVRGLSRRHTVDASSSEILKELAKISVKCVREDSDDSDSSRSSASSSVSRPRTLRRNWDATPRIQDNRRGPMMIPRSQGGSAGQNRIAQPGTHVPRDYSSDHQRTGRRDTRSSRQQRISVSNRICSERSCSSCTLGSADEFRRAENGALPASLPWNLLKIGKEVLRHRDLAILTAIEALQEACAAERLIQCLSTYPELQSSKEEDPRGLVDRFLCFLGDLKQARLVAQSLARVTPRTANSDSISSLPSKHAVQVATENRQHAASWIKAAMESDDSLPPAQLKATDDSTADPTPDGRPSSTIAHSKLLPSMGKPRLNYDMWLKGTGPLVAADLASTLMGESNRWFMGYIEKFLDGALSESIGTASENHVAGLLFQIKKVDEWLDGVACRDTASWRDSCKENLAESEEMEACQRVRKKIYGILLKQVDRAATALENASVSDEGSASEEQD